MNRANRVSVVHGRPSIHKYSSDSFELSPLVSQEMMRAHVVRFGLLYLPWLPRPIDAAQEYDPDFAFPRVIRERIEPGIVKNDEV